MSKSKTYKKELNAVFEKGGGFCVYDSSAPAVPVCKQSSRTEQTFEKIMSRAVNWQLFKSGITCVMQYKINRGK